MTPALNAAYVDPAAVADDDSSYEGAGIPDGTPDRLSQFAEAQGDISDQLSATELASLGLKAVEDWNSDKGSIQAWRDAAETALKQASQNPAADKTFPWAGASNIQYPLLTVASQQFAARAYPAIVKGDEAVGVKVIGSAPKLPDMPANMPPADQMPPEMQQQIQSAVIIPFQEAQAKWQAKQSRAHRVKTWLNYHIFHGMDDWEGGTDTLLNQLPIAGSAFKKVYFDPMRGVCSDYVSALHLTVHKDTETLDRCPRVTQDFQLYPYEIRSRMKSGVYRDVDTVLLDGDDDDQAPKQIIEQHRLDDLDGDGIEEPYILTVDVESCAVLRIEAAYGPDDIARAKEGDAVVKIRRWMPFIHFLFMPDPEGGFYGLGFGQLLAPMTAVINTAINQLMDAGTAAAAGGGFIGSGLRLQGAGQTPSLKFMPGEYKFVSMAGADLRNAIWERTIPQPSPVLFQLLDLVLGAAKDIASIKEVLSGDSPATAPVGTTLALIEQGLQSFSAIYKRVYRSEKLEFRAIYECQGKWGSQAEYAEVLDDPQADLKADFSAKGDDIVPVSDPSVVTRAQALAKVQVIQQTAVAFPGAVNPAEAAKRIFEAAQIDEPEALIVQPPKEPPPNVVAELKKTDSETAKNVATAQKTEAETKIMTGEAQTEGALDAAFSLGAAHEGVVPGVEGAPGQPMGVQGAQGGGGPPEAGVGSDLVDQGGGGPVGADGAALAG